MYLDDGKYEFRFFRTENAKGSRVDTVCVARLNRAMEKGGWFKVCEVGFNPNDGKSTNPPTFNKSVGQYLALQRACNILNVSFVRRRYLGDMFFSKLSKPLPEWVSDLL